MMYVHAWQSYIWNRAVSERIKMLGPNAIVAGDLVFADADGSNSAAPPEQPIDTPVPTKIPAVHVVTQEEIDAGKYTVFDVVLPLPGFGVHYPEGKIGELYRRIMSDDKVDIDNMFRKQKCAPCSCRDETGADHGEQRVFAGWSVSQDVALAERRQLAILEVQFAFARSRTERRGSTVGQGPSRGRRTRSVDPSRGRRVARAADRVDARFIDVRYDGVARSAQGLHEQCSYERHDGQNGANLFGGKHEQPRRLARIGTARSTRGCSRVK